MNQEVEIVPRELVWDGERYMPGMGGRIAVEHGARYVWAGRYSRGKTVLDVASGEGYGSATLARVAKNVIGVDLSDAAIYHAQQAYKAVENLEFRSGSLIELPLEDQSIDVVVCFETIEHVTDHNGALKEIARVLRPDGILLISTPDREIYSERYRYTNPFHFHEFSAEEFKEALSSAFTSVRTLFQISSAMSIIDESDSDAERLLSVSDLNLVNITDMAGHASADSRVTPIYCLAICTNGDLRPAAAQALGMIDVTGNVHEDEMVLRSAVETPDTNKSLLTAYLRLLDEGRIKARIFEEALARLRRDQQHDLSQRQTNMLRSALETLRSEHRKLWKQIAETEQIRHERDRAYQQLNSIFRSTSWRALNVAQRFFGSKPRLRRAIRGILLRLSKHGELS